MTTSCDQLGVCQSRIPACANCHPKPVPAARQGCCNGACNQGRSCPMRNPIALEGPYTRPLLDWARLLQSVQSSLHTLWRYLKGPSW